MVEALADMAAYLTAACVAAAAGGLLGGPAGAAVGFVAALYLANAALDAWEVAGDE